MQENHLWSLVTHFYLGFNLATQILKSLDYFFLGILRFEVLDGMNAGDNLRGLETVIDELLWWPNSVEEESRCCGIIILLLAKLPAY